MHDDRKGRSVGQVSIFEVTGTRPRGRKSVFVAFRHIGRQMFPKAIVSPLGFIVEALAALALDQTLATAGIRNNDHPKLGIDFPLAIPIAAGGTDFHFGGNDYFFLIHGELATGFVRGQSVYLSNGSFKENIPSLAIISV